MQDEDLLNNVYQAIDEPETPLNLENLEAAHKELGLNKQERDYYIRHLKNMHGPGGVDNEDGTRSTVLTQVSKYDDRHYLIPTIRDGKVLDPGEKMSATANRLAEEEGLENFPSYPSEEEARERYNAIHKFMDLDR